MRRRRHVRLHGRWGQAHPCRVECGAGLTRSAPCGTQAWLQSKGGVAFQPARDRPGECGSEETQGCAWVRLFSTLARDVGPGAFPRRHSVAAAAKAHVRWALPILFPDVPKRLPPDACAHVTRRQDDAQSCPRGKRSLWCMAESQTRRRIVPRPGTVWKRDRGWASCCCAVVRRKSARSFSICASEGMRARSTSRVFGTATSSQRSAHPCTVGCVGHLLADLGPGRRAGGLVHRRSKVRALAHQGRAASEQSAGGAYVRRRDLGVWQQASAEQRRNLVGIELVVCGLAAVHGLHGASMPQHEGEACCGPAVGEPVPGEETRDGHDQAVTRGRHRLEKRCRRGWSWCGGAALRPRGSRCRRTYSGHARRYRRKRGAEWWRIALRSPPRS